jgi:hypothetical protein
MDNETGSFLATLAGSYIGGILGLVGLGRSESAVMEKVFFPGMSLAASIGATIAFNLTRKYDSSADLNGQKYSAAPPIHFDLLRMKF